MEKPMNIVVIMNDTWRYDHVGAHGNDWIHTPVLDQFAEESTVFERQYCGSFATIPIRHDIWKGRFGNPIHDWGPLDWESLTLPEVLRKSGYVTMLIHDTPHLINYGYGFDRPFHAWDMIRGNEVDRMRTDHFKEWKLDGFDKFRSAEMMALYHRQTKDWELEEDCWAPQVMDATCKWLERNSDHEKFFLWVDSFDPHEPWDPPQHYVDLYDKDYDGLSVFWPRYDKTENFLTPREQEHVANLFAAECTMCDRHIGRVLDTIDRQGLRDNTIVIIMSDHGHYLGDHGLQSKSGPLYEEVSRQIMMVRHPEGIGAGKRVQALVQPADIAPSLLELSQVATPKDMDIQGRSWASLLKKDNTNFRTAAVSATYPTYSPTTGFIKDEDSNTSRWSEQGWTSMTVTGQRYTLMDFPERDRWLLFDRETDPAMENNIVKDLPEEAEILHAELIKFLQANEAPQWMVQLWSDGPEGITAPEPSEFWKNVRKRGKPHANPLWGNIKG